MKLFCQEEAENPSPIIYCRPFNSDLSSGLNQMPSRHPAMKISVAHTNKDLRLFASDTTQWNK